MTFKEQLLFAVASWKWWQRYLATLFVLLALCVAWWFLSFSSLLEQWRHVRCYTPASEAVQTPDKQRSVPAEFPQQAEPESLVTVFAKRRDAFFAPTTLAQITSALFNRCAAHRLRVEEYSLAPLQNKTWYAASEMQLVLLGSFFSMINFLEWLQRHETIIAQRLELLAEETCPVSTISGDCPMRLICTLTIMLPLEQR